MDYSIEDKNHAECLHAEGFWPAEDLMICPACGAVVGLIHEHEPNQTSQSNLTVYLYVEG